MMTRSPPGLLFFSSEIRAGPLAEQMKATADKGNVASVSTAITCSWYGADSVCCVVVVVGVHSRCGHTLFACCFGAAEAPEDRGNQKITHGQICSYQV